MPNILAVSKNNIHISTFTFILNVKASVITKDDLSRMSGINIIRDFYEKIEIDEENNQLWGTLKESAMDLIKEHEYGDEEYQKAFEVFQNQIAFQP